MLVRLNILVEGVYQHAVYGELEYSLPVLERLKANHERGLPGYRVPLFIGHNLNPERVGGSPAVGFLVPGGLTIEPDADGRHRLFGTFEMVLQSVYEQIWRGEYRYGSAEIAPAFLDKESGEEVGPVLLAHVLTNQPFIPNLARNQVLSHVPSLFFYQEYPMSNETNKEQELETTAVNLIREAFDAYRQEAERKLSEQQQELEALREELRQLRKQKREAELAGYVREVESLSLPQALKEKYIPMIQADQLSDRELSLVLENLRAVSQYMGSLMFSQVGSLPETQANPYQDIIQRNLDMAKQPHN